MRNMESGANSPRSTISTPPSLDTVVSLLRTSNVEPLVRDLAKEIEGRFDLLRSQIREGRDEGRILELIQDQEKNILDALRQVEYASGSQCAYFPFALNSKYQSALKIRLKFISALLLTSALFDYRQSNQSK
jgi:hypothetical protein